MTNTLKKIWNSKNGNLIFFLLFVSIGGVYLYFDRPNVTNRNDLIEINGTFKDVHQVLTNFKKIKPTARDSTYHIYLDEFASKFQVSYFPYNKKEFYKNTNPGDKIKLHIASQDKKYLDEPDSKIRSFSLTVNSKTYLSVDSGLRGFGKGRFELIMIFLPLTIMTILIYRILKKNNRL
jgi:hypothetical protein